MIFNLCDPLILPCCGLPLANSTCPMKQCAITLRTSVWNWGMVATSIDLQMLLHDVQQDFVS